ncbi:response regulator [uncultured Dokdonia sp.]|uniref:response regulator n=1 Tax=uncultured Dokdonia sp. TaxID=575653 RepID=UPI00262B5522|nr:response regulator [uncultured Dokdonia sp.]
MLTIFSANGQNKQKTDSLLVIIKNSTSDSITARNYIKLGNQYRRATKPDSAMMYAKKALTYSLRFNDPETIGRNYLFMGAVEFYRWNIGDAMGYYQKVDSILMKHNIKNRDLYIAHSDRAELYRRSITSDSEKKEAYNNAMFYYKKALVVAQDLKDSIDIGKTYTRIGSVQSNLGNFEEAQKYFNKVENHYLKYVYLGNYYNDYGSLYLKMGDTINYIKYVKLAYDIKNKGRSNFVRALGQKEYANALFFSKKYDQSITMSKQSADFFASLDPPDYGRLSGIYKNLSDVYSKIGDYKNAYQYIILNEIVDDSIANRDRKDKAKELETKYQTEKKEQEIALLQAQNETVEAQKKNQRNLLLGGLGLTSIAGVFLFLGFRNRKKTNDKLRELDTMKSSFFENISHEFRTPLSLIAGPVEEQLQKPDIGTLEKKNLNIAKRNTQRLLTLVDQLLDLSKVEAGHFKLNVQQGDLSLFLKSLTSSFSYLAHENNQEYITTIDVPKNTYYFDADALEKIITNLISNALKYSPDGESITITSAIENQKLQFTIQNSGATLSEEALQTIFNRFARTDEQTAGTGIGLALSKELVALHKGSIDAQSTHNTTTFTITIPVTESAFSDSEKTTGVMEMSAFAKAETTTSKEKIIQEEVDIFSKDTNPILLIVDDNADLRTYVSSLFEDQYTIHTAQDGKEGYEIASSIVPDLIITDLMMPKDDGVTLTRNCKASETTSHIPIIMLTAKAGDENQLIGLETGADAYITKPFNTEILKTTTHNLLETRKKLQERFSQEVVLIPKDIAANSVDERFLDNLKEIVDTQIIESDFTTESFAKALGMSRMQLHRKLKALTGLSATEFIRSQRLKLAAQLLKKSDINVSQVGYAVGFNNHSYFTKCFKEHYGVSPSDYAKKA